MQKCASRLSNGLLLLCGLRHYWPWVLPLAAPRETVVRKRQGVPLPEVAALDPQDPQTRAAPAGLQAPRQQPAARPYQAALAEARERAARQAMARLQAEQPASQEVVAWLPAEQAAA
jgi:hypothetical protein